MVGADLHLEHVSKRFGPVAAVDDVSLEVAAGEHLALVGPSGCGKSTLLQLIAGLVLRGDGVIRIGGTLVAGAGAWVPPERRRVGMVFQDYALFAHLSVAGNVAFGLDRLPRSQRSARVEEVLSLVGLDNLARRYPHELSNGQQQRVALARSLAPEPAVMLLDEPFSNLDRALRDDLRVETKSVLRATGTTTVLVTHDQSEALTFGDRVAVMSEGRLVQVASPEEVFEQPETVFVARLIGAADFLPARREDDGTLLTDLGPLEALVPLPPGGQIGVMVRPHQLDFEVDEEGPARITGREYRGAFALYELTFPSGCRLHSQQAIGPVHQPGTRARAWLHHGPAALFLDGRRITLEGRIANAMS